VACPQPIQGRQRLECANAVRNQDEHEALVAVLDESVKRGRPRNYQLMTLLTEVVRSPGLNSFAKNTLAPRASASCQCFGDPASELRVLALLVHELPLCRGRGEAVNG